MNTISLRNVFFLISLAAFAVVGNDLAAQAETINGASALPAVSQAAPEQISTVLTAAASTASESEQTQLNNTAEPQNLQQNTPVKETASSTTPLPGTTNTSAASLSQERPPTYQPTQPVSEIPAPKKVGQAPISPGRPTQSGSSYVGIAGNIGLSGSGTDLGDGNFAVISKIGLTNTFSVRPGAVIGDNPTILIPVTYDFSFNPTDAFSEPLPIAPYLGAGVVIGTGDETDVGPMITAGVDFPITNQFTATAGVNIGFVDDTSVGLQIGVGYNFGRLFGF